MKLSELKQALIGLQEIWFQLPDESFVPKHFHVTEIGKITKEFIDCGGTIRTENKISFQLWQDERDLQHRLNPKKLIDIIELSEKALGLVDAEIVVEYQEQTIGKFDLEFDGSKFLLFNTYTDCLAQDKCKTPIEKTKVQLREFGGKQPTVCVPRTGCC